MKTLVGSPYFDDVTWDDCLEWINWKPNQRARFFDRYGEGQLLGQAWFNSLRSEDAEKLRGTLYDPFYKDEKKDIILALAYLLEN